MTAAECFLNGVYNGSSYVQRLPEMFRSFFAGLVQDIPECDQRKFSRNFPS